jgi:ABC-type ATPase with predicted acetyltransferase domain
MCLDVAYQFLPKQPTVRTSQVMDHFGVSFEQGAQIIVAGLELPVQSGQVICFTGDSGSGKSSLLRNLAGQLTGVCDLEGLTLEHKSLVDQLPVPLAEALELLAACGLGEAHLLLRTPFELSEGQRYRFRLALAIARAAEWVLADEFTATLDRTLAQVIAFNVRKLCHRRGIGFLLATTHADILDDLQADLHIACRLQEPPFVTSRQDTSNGKKKAFTSSTHCRSAPDRKRTGRIFLGGITAATNSGL